VKRLDMIMMASLATFGGLPFAGCAVPSAYERARFTLSVIPAQQTGTRGRAVSFSVTVARASGFTGATALRVARLPRGVRARWQLADGTRTGVVPLKETGAVLTLRTSARTPLGARRVKVLATGGGSTRARVLTLTVKRPRSGRFSLRVRPARQTVPRGAAATYQVRVARTAGFRGRVELRVVRLPRGRVTLTVPGPTGGASAMWGTDTALTVSTRARQRPGSRRLVVQGTGWVRGKAVRRYAVAVLTVVRVRPFPIAGDLKTLLYPGRGASLDLVLTNPHPFDIRVTALSVSVRPRTSNPGCSADANYAVRQYRGGYPLVLHPGSTRLSELDSNSAIWPQVSMHNLPTNQDACKHARLSLDYRGLATR
jgi:hypothetical protein